MKNTPATSDSSAIRRLFAAIPHAVFVWLGAFLVQFLVLNMIAGSRHFLPDGDDMKFYNDWALKLLGQLAWKPGEPNSPGTAYYGLPGYAYALAGIYKVTGGYSHTFSPFLIAQLQAALNALTATWLFLLGRRVFGGGGDARRGTAIGLLAAAAWALFTPAQVFSAILMPTAWVVCAFWGVTYWLVCIHEKGAASWWRPWLWIGLLAGFVAMLVATILMLLPLVVFAIALTVGRGRPLRARILPALGTVAVLMAGVYAGCSPVWIHNYFVARDRVLLSAHDGLNFYLGNHANSNGYTSIPKGLRASQDGLLKDSLTIPEKELGHPLKRSEASAFWKKKGVDFIRGQPLAWLRLLRLKFANFWNAFQYDDLSILKLLRDEVAVPPGLRFGFAAALGLPGLLLCWRRWPRSRWVAGATLLHMAALMPVFITERYRLAAAPGLLLLAVGGLWLLWENIASREWSKVALQTALILCAAWFTSIPQPDIGLWSLDFYKAGIRNTDGVTDAMSRASYFTKQAAEASARGDAGAARKNTEAAARQNALIPDFLSASLKNLESAYAYAPNSEHNAFALGDVWYYKKDYTKAKLCFERAVQLSAEGGRPHEGALHNLGRIALDEKRPKEAQIRLQWSLQSDPDDATAWRLLAEAFRDQENITDAERAIAQAIRRNPANPEFLKFRDDLRKPVPPPLPVPSLKQP
jgi:tetratricopeptide (TPR) repeat protein